MKLIVGLGNPGREYAGTRHNVGFMVVERIADRRAIAGAKGRFHASVLEGAIDGRKVMLMEPTTYMNRSGRAVGEAARFYKLDPADVMVVVDDTALPLGAIRIRPKGGPGAHNGLADIERALASDQYPRLRLGIGEPRVNDRPIAQRDYVLGRFTDEQLAEITPAVDRAAQAAECWAARGIDAAMNQFNVATDPRPESNADPDPDPDPERR